MVIFNMRYSGSIKTVHNEIYISSKNNIYFYLHENDMILSSACS